MNDSIINTLVNDTINNGFQIAVGDSIGTKKIVMNMSMKFKNGQMKFNSNHINDMMDLPVNDMMDLPDAIANIATLGIAMIIIGNIVFFATIFAIAYFYFKTKNKEKLAMIEKGINPNANKTKDNLNGVLKWGFILIGIGIGYILGEITPIPTFALILLFGGIGLMSYYFIAPKLNKDK